MEPHDLWRLERQYRAQGLELICGADEAGAGPLAGDVYAAAVESVLGLKVTRRRIYLIDGKRFM